MLTFITTMNELYVFGNNDYGQIGNRSSYEPKILSNKQLKLYVVIILLYIWIIVTIYMDR